MKNQENGYSATGCGSSSEVMTLLKNSLIAKWAESVDEKYYNEILEAVYQRNLSPLKAVDILIGKFINK